jgi:hypothetical protein
MRAKSSFIAFVCFMIAIAPSYLLAGTEIMPHTYILNNQDFSSVAMDSNANFTASWQSSAQDTSGLGIYSRRFNNNLVPMGTPESLVNTYFTGDQKNPDIAMRSNGEYVIVWWGAGSTDSNGVYGQRYNSDGTKNGGQFPVNSYTSNTQKFPSVKMAENGKFVVVWFGAGNGDGTGIFAQLFNADGSKNGSEFKVNQYTSNTQEYPNVAMDAVGNFVVTWDGNGAGDGTGIYARRYDSNGSPLGSYFPVNTYKNNSQRYPDISMDSAGNFVITWESYGVEGNSNYGIAAQMFYANGSQNGTEFVVNTGYTNYDQKTVTTAMAPNGKFIIVWESNQQDGSGYGIYAQKFTAGGVPDGAMFKVNTYTSGDQKNNSVTMVNNGFAIAFTGPHVTTNYQGNCTEDYGTDVYIYQEYTPTNDSIDLESFTAESKGDSTILKWRTGTEIDNLGFYLVKYENDRYGYTLLNTDIIPAMGTLYSGYSYSFIDENINTEGSNFYWLVDVNINGEFKVHGPVKVVFDLN